MGKEVLDFSIVGGTTQPSSANENTIWVNTSNTITSWDFNATEPEAPEEGMVWFYTGARSPYAFNALKENRVQVYPIQAKQYLDGAWQTIQCSIFQKGVWSELMNYLYYQGNEFEDLTGGWEGRAWPWVSWGSAVTPTLTLLEDRMSVTVRFIHNNNGNGCAIQVKKDIDLTDISLLIITFKKIEVTWASSTYKFQAGIYVADRDETYFSNAVASTIHLIDSPRTEENVQLTLDVSEITGTYDVFVGLSQQVVTPGNGNGGGTHTVEVESIEYRY